MNFEWKLEKNKELSFEDKVHNLACFEIVVNILRMKTKAGDNNVSEEIKALCGFALDCMFKDTHIDDDMFDDILLRIEKTENDVEGLLGALDELGLRTKKVEARLGIG